jgi:hypothetical protein
VLLTDPKKFLHDGGDIGGIVVMLSVIMNSDEDDVVPIAEVGDGHADSGDFVDDMISDDDEVIPIDDKECH